LDWWDGVTSHTKTLKQMILFERNAALLRFEDKVQVKLGLKLRGVRHTHILVRVALDSWL